MGREIRKVHKDWVHPKNEYGNYQPKFDQGYKAAVEEWGVGKALWEKGTHPDQTEGYDYEEWSGDEPEEEYYMPDWTEQEKTHVQMYENVSEGTPISPVFPDVETLARWLVDNEANAGAGRTATYEQWLRVCKGGYAPTMVIAGGVLTSGVEALSSEEKTDE